MTTALATKQMNEAESIEKVLLTGDLKALTPDQRLSYYRQTCESLGLNPLTKPFEYVTLNGKLTLYARKDATDQLRKIHSISIDKPEIQQIDDLILVTVAARDAEGRTDSDIGVVKKTDMGGNVANALMKAVTKAKRRVTLSICGLGMLDETEVETIPEARPQLATKGELVEAAHETPDVSRENRIAHIQWTVKELNKAGDSIKWTPAKLKEYTNELFSVEDGLDSLSFESLDMLIDDLETRLEDVQSGPPEVLEVPIRRAG